MVLPGNHWPKGNMMLFDCTDKRTDKNRQY